MERDLKDAAIEQLSADRRFSVAYNAVQQLAKAVLACEGFRVSTSKTGGHATTFEAAGLILGPAHQSIIDYFDVCRQKRNQVNYDHAGLISDAEATELVERANAFRSLIENWVRQNHSQYLQRTGRNGLPTSEVRCANKLPAQPAGRPLWRRFRPRRD